MKILLFAGAGTSVELGVPRDGRPLPKGFLEHCRQWSIQPGLVERILAQSMDVEELIETLDRLCGGGSVFGAS